MTRAVIYKVSGRSKGVGKLLPGFEVLIKKPTHIWCRKE
jgi:hypothetical protein